MRWHINNLFRFRKAPYNRGIAGGIDIPHRTGSGKRSDAPPGVPLGTARVHERFFNVGRRESAIPRRGNSSPLINDVIESFQSTFQLTFIRFGHPIRNYGPDAFDKLVVRRRSVRTLGEGIAAQHPDERNCDSVKCALRYGSGEGRYTRRLDIPVNALVICTEVFVMGPIPGAGRIVNCDDEPRFFSADST